MDGEGSITHWLMEIQDGSEEAVNAIWERYFQKLAAVVRGQLASKYRVATDESDVALSALHCFFQGVEEGRFVNVRGRDQLWRVLVMIAKRKAIGVFRRESAQRRGGGWTENDALLQEISNSEPTPELTAIVRDELDHLLALLRAEDAVLALIAARKCEGASNQEIAAELTVSPRTIERNLLRIDIIWAEDVQRRFGDGE